ncbi:MAG: ABC transporter substrate-binding protein [Candidatus Acetothermia bacterium]
MFKSTEKLFGLFAVILAISLLVGAGSVARAETYKVGTIWPMTGTSAAFGVIQKANSLVEEYVNEAGGIRGYDLELVQRDSASEPNKGVDAARKLVNVEGVHGMVGAYSSGVAMAVAEGVTIPNEIPYITIGTSPTISVVDDDDYFFRTSAHDLFNGRVLGDAMWDDGHEKVGIIYVNNAYGQGLADAAAVTIEEIHDGEVLGKVPFEIGKSSYTSQLKQAYADGEVDAALIIAYPEDATTMHNNIVALGYQDIPWYGSPDQKVPELIDSLGVGYMSSIQIGSTQGRWEGPSNDSFVNGYKEEYGEEPPKPYMAPGFDAVASMALAIAATGEDPGEITGTDIRDQLRPVTSPPGEEIYATPEGFEKAFSLLEEGKDINYIGASGKIEFDKYGDAMSAIQTWTITEDGNIKVVENVLPEPIPRDLMGEEYQG